MRLFSRSVIVGIMVLSCSSDPGIGPVLPPGSCATFTADTVFELHPDSLHLVVGAVDQPFVQYGIDCSEQFLTTAPPSINWTVRDMAIAETDTEDSFTALVRSLSPGRTYLVAEVAGISDSLAVFVPDTVAVGAVRSVAAGARASCLTTTGDVALCWGDGTGGILGAVEANPPIGTCWGVLCSPLPVTRATGARGVAVGGTHACGLGPSGSAFCWGDNALLQTGWQQPGLAEAPVGVPGGHTFSELSLGRFHSCGLTTAGDIYCWGDHSGGKLGADQRTGPVAEPVLVSGGEDWIAVDARDGGACAVTDVGHLYCWGVFDTAVPGTETCQVSTGAKGGPTQAPCSWVPLRIGLEVGPSADSVLVEVSGRCGLTTMGSALCTPQGTSTFERIKGTDGLTSLTGGLGHACGLTAAGEAWCWGDNGFGQLGDGTTTFPPFGAPVPVTGGHTFLELAVGDFHTCGLTAAEEVWCWGGNDQGQAGVPLLTMPLVPARVRGQG